MPRRSLLGVLPAIALLALPGLAAIAAASTNSEPSRSPCVLGASTLEAGTPLALSGTRSTNEPIGVMVRRADGEFREPAVVTINQTWRAVLLFGVAAGFIAHEVAALSTIEIAVGLANVPDPSPDGLPGTAWWRTVP